MIRSCVGALANYSQFDPTFGVGGPLAQVEPNSSLASANVRAKLTNPVGQNVQIALGDGTQRDRNSLRVSIIIRNRNYDQFLADAIDSALAQTHPIVEVIVVDDGSTDNSRTVLKKYSARCNVLLQNSGGEGAAVNSGFAACSGDVVTFLDSDDVLAPNAVATVVSHWGEDVSRICYRLYVMSEKGILTDSIIPIPELPDLTLEEQFAKFGQVVTAGQSSNAYSWWALKKILPLNPKLWRRSPDCYLNALATVQGNTRLIQRPLGGYRIHSNNLTVCNSLDSVSRNEILHFHRNTYEAVRAFVGDERWHKFSPRPPSYHWFNRMLSFRLNPEEHSFAEDHRWQLFRECWVAVCRRPATPFTRRLFLIGCLLVITFIPRTVLRRNLLFMLQFARKTAVSYRRAFAGKTPDDSVRHWRKFYAVEASSSAGESTRRRIEQ